MNGNRIVIVGAGLAGFRSAERLRELGWSGSITMVGDERSAPYNRPPLSKQVLEGRMRPEELSFTSYVDLDAECLFGSPAAGLDPANRVLNLHDGREVPYDGLIVATGVGARHLPNAPMCDERVLTLRTLSDCRALDKAMSSARHLAIVGGGFIGCELAAAARARALDVTIIDSGATLLQRVLGRELGSVITALHRRKGVRLQLETSVIKWTTGKHGVGLELTNGEHITADVVVVAVGASPRVEWLAGSGANIDDGVLCDPTCHVIGLDRVVAAGDVARWPNLRFDAQPRRVEHWIHAVEQGRAAAENLLAGPAAAKPFMPLPRFWSEQHGMRIQSVGMPGLAQRAALAEGSPESDSMVVVYLGDHRLVGAVGINSPRAMLRYSELVESATRPVPLAQPNFPRPARARAMHPNHVIASHTTTTRPQQPVARPQQPVARPAHLVPDQRATAQATDSPAAAAPPVATTGSAALHLRRVPTPTVATVAVTHPRPRSEQHTEDEVSVA